jgi:PAP2 superfamily
MAVGRTRQREIHGGFRTSLAWVAYKLVTVGVGAGLFLGTYRAVAVLALGYGEGVDLMTPLDRWIPFLPWTWWFYVPAYALGLLVALALIDERRIYHRSLLAILAIGAFNAVFYLTMPAVFPRAGLVVEPGWTAAAFAWLWETDLPNNTFPSSHVAVGAFSVFVSRQTGRRLAIVPLICAVAVSITVLTTKQHFWVDSVSGWLVGWLAYRLIMSPVTEGSRQRP